MKIGVIGLGKMGLLHAGILNTFDDVEIFSIAEKEELITKYVKQAIPTTTVYNDYNKMLNSETLDLVYITTPTVSHFPIMLLCIDKNFNFFVEKPLSMNFDEAKEICSKLHKTNLIHGVGYNIRFLDTFSKTKSLLDNKILGTISSVNSSMFSSTVTSKHSGWRFKKQTSGGGALLELGCHLIDLLLWYFGKIDTVNGEISSIFSSVEDSAKMSMTFSNGINGKLETSWSAKGYRIPELTIEMIGSNGTIKVNQDYIEIKLKNPLPEFPQKETIIHKQMLEKGVSFDVGGPDYTKEDFHIINCLKEQKLPLVNVYEASKTQSVIEAMYHSASIKNSSKVDYIE